MNAPSHQNPAPPAPPAPPSVPGPASGPSATQHALHHLFSGGSLSLEQADAAMTEIMGGVATAAQIGAFLAALRIKGESVEEIAGCAQAMRRAALRVSPNIGETPLVDIVGTGGDSSFTFNISTTAALVVAGHGLKVAKHGNRSVSSKCGAADVLAALGANLQLGPEQAAACIEEVGFAFLFAPVFHPAMRHAIGPRRELASRTVFNILGPLSNPAHASHFLLGVYDPALTEPMAQVLARSGAVSAYVVHGAGTVDELTLSGPNRITHLRDGVLRTFEFSASELGLEPAPLAALVGGDAEQNAAITRNILRGSEGGARRDAVLLNAAFALATVSGDPATGLAQARASLESGAALHLLERYLARSQQLPLS